MSTQDIGRKLRDQRQQRGLDLDAAAKATRIRKQTLQALEQGEFDSLPSAAQVHGFLRAYANYLELDPEPLLAELKPVKIEEPTPSATGNQPPAAASNASQANQQATLAFAALGAELRQRRKSMELTLLEVEENTHIPEHYLTRLEKGDFDTFPSPTQARGMLGNYAEFLGLESDALLLRYAEALQQRFQARALEKPVRSARVRPTLPAFKFRLPDWAQPLLTRDIAFGAAAGLGLLVFLLFSIGRILSTRAAEQIQPTAPPLVNLLLPSASATLGAFTTPAITQESINLLEQPTTNPGLVGDATIQAASTGNIAVRLLATQRTWMRVIVDGRVEFEGRTVPGQSYNFAADGQILLLTGNAAALRVFYNDQDLGVLGIYGEVVQVVFNAQGAATPTVSPTPTINPQILTSTAGAAQTPSATPSATATPTPTVDSGSPTP